ILINSFRQLAKEYVEIEKLIIGGENDDWPVHDRSKSLFYEESNYN
ncbi:MAG: DUF3531 family protein, partial [Moorea sp. SIO4G2]|nr:DUF3531 family protein [Moorena sp. SIO4G2]